MNTATKIKDLDGFTGDAALYRLEPALNEDGFENHYVVVSATYGPRNEETYIFPADDEGEVTCWLPLEGSFNGGLDHKKALAGAGYTIHDLAQ